MMMKQKYGHCKGLSMRETTVEDMLNVFKSGTPVEQIYRITTQGDT
jgi:hypothetical protein